MMMVGSITVSALTLVTFAGCLVWAYLTHDENAKALLVGAAVANSTAAVQFWLGSSAGSQKKDDTIAAAKGSTP